MRMVEEMLKGPLAERLLFGTGAPSRELTSYQVRPATFGYFVNKTITCPSPPPDRPQ
jgi:hypothetical protein